MDSARPLLMLASMDVDPAHELLFNELYDQEHIPNLLGVPGVASAIRFRAIPGEMAIGGERRALESHGSPKYHVLYEISDSEVLVSPDWERAVERGRWPTLVRPHTRNRRHLLLEPLADVRGPLG